MIDRPDADAEVAIVGLACRLPGAPDLDAFWRLLVEGREGTRRFTAEELLAAGVPAERLADPRYVPVKGWLEDAECFDARFFGQSPRDARLMDPQHRVFLECAWHAIEHAGYRPDAMEGSVGVWAGCGWPAYLLGHLRTDEALLDTDDGYFKFIANDKDFLATRVAWHLGLTGPAIDVQSGCSTALVAVAQACTALLTWQCDAALAGAVSVTTPTASGYVFREGGIMSPDGRCRPFDARGRGIVPANGVGAVLLKRLPDAIADGDVIHAIIRGFGVNNDGRDKVGFTAPSVRGQEAAIRMAHAVARVAPGEITYVEAHGTATALGDPVEVTALNRAFADAPDGHRCLLGSVKSNLGHLDPAAGIAGLIKTVLALEHGIIPGTVHFERPNPAIPFDEGPFEVAGEARPWPAVSARIAGISAFGVGGTNAHLVLEEGPPRGVARGGHRGCCVLPIAGHCRAAAERGVAALDAALDAAGPRTPLAAMAHTLAHGRKPGPWRSYRIARQSADGAVHRHGRAEPVREVGPGGPIVFMFPGQGAQRPGMGRALYRQAPVFREVVDRCAAVYAAETGRALGDLLFPDPRDPAAEARLRQTRHAQPALFAVELATAHLLLDAGIEPAVMIGHSLGEYVAATLAGVFDVERAMRLVTLRGALVQEMPAGAMTSVFAPAEVIRPMLGDAVDLAAINGPELCVVSGPLDAIDAIEARLERGGIPHRRLRTSHAFHSASMGPARDAFRAVVAEVGPRAPARPFVSNVTGRLITADEARDPGYWAEHLRAPVRFADGIAALPGGADAILVEVGPGRGLCRMARGIPPAGRQAVATEVSAIDADAGFAAALGALWSLGAPVRWPTPEGLAPSRAPAPLTAFDRTRHWVEPPAPRASAVAPPVAACFAREVEAPVDVDPSAEPGGSWWVMALHDADRARAAALADRLAADGPTRQITAEALPAGAGRLVIVAGTPAGASPEARLAAAIDRAFGPLAAALAAAHAHGRASVAVLVDDAPDTRVEARVFEGPILAALEEYPGLVCRLARVGEPFAALDPARIAALIAGAAPIAALRDGRLLALERPPMPAPSVEAGGVRPGGVYLVTGGLGGIGSALGERLLTAHGARLALLVRRAPTGEAAARLAALREAGPDLMLVEADMTDRSAVEAAVQRVVARWGRIDGAFHAAGVAGGGRLDGRARAAIDAVFGAKVLGARHLVDALAPHRPGFVMLFSSTSAIEPAFGQADYASANACLDALAATTPGVCAVRWGAWAEVGMAVDGATRHALAGGVPLDHPFGLCRMPAGEGGLRYAALLEPSLWLVAEHRVAGCGLVPATGMFEMVRACAADGLARGGDDEIRLIEPLVVEALWVPEGEVVEVRITLTAEATGRRARVALESRPLRGPLAARPWVRHLVARVEAAPATARAVADLAAIEARCPDARDLTALDDNPLGIHFGPRWHCVEQARVGRGEAIARLRLDPAFAADRAALAFHPAVMDIAIGFGAIVLRGALTAERAHYIPLSYAALHIARPLPAQAVAHARLVGGGDGAAEIRLDVDVFDREGAPVAVVRDFCMKRLEAGIRAPEAGEGRGLPTAVGVDACLALTGARGAGIAVTAAPLGAASEAGAVRSAAVRTDDVTAGLCRLVADLLGLDRVAPTDDFFALGGHSLLLVRLMAAVDDAFGVRPAMDRLTEATSVGDMAALIEAARETPPVEGEGALAGLDPAARALVVPLKAGAPDTAPLICLHPAGGAVSMFLDIARGLPPGLGAVGLRGRGADGRDPPDRDLDAMVERYLPVVRALGAGRPLRLCGMSMGGIVAYELARRLAAEGHRVAAVALLDTPCAETAREEAVIDTPEGVLAFVRDLSPEVAARIEAARAVDDGSDLSHFVETWIAHNAIWRRYRPVPYAGPVTFYTCREAGSAGAVFEGTPLERPWLDAAPAMRVVEVPGNHLTMVTGALGRALGARIAEDVGASGAAPSGPIPPAVAPADAPRGQVVR